MDFLIATINSDKSCANIRHKKKYNNRFVNKGDYYEMYDNNNNMCVIDIDDYERVSQFYWGKYQGSNYFCSCTGGQKQWLHRYLMGAVFNEYVDHKNNNCNDYRKSNLRICNNAENNRNRWLQSNNTSGYPGINWAKREKKWRARIKVNGREIHLGYFNDKSDAIKAKQVAEEKYFGIFSYKNSQKEATYVC